MSSSLLNESEHSVWTILQDLLRQHLPPALHHQIDRFPLLTTLSTLLMIHFCYSVIWKNQRPSFLVFRLIDRAYGLIELVTHTQLFGSSALSGLSSALFSKDPDRIYQSPSTPNHHLSDRSLFPNRRPGSLKHDSPAQCPKVFYPGLINSSSNLCFLNAVLQSLASMPHIIQYLDLIQSYDIPYSPVANALREMLLALNSPRDHQIVLKPFSVAQALLGHPSARRSMLFNSEQQDAQEFLVTMIDALEAEAKLLAENLLLEYQSTQADGLERNQFLIQARTIRRSPFRALMAHRIACGTCGFTSVIRHSSADHFSLNVPPKTTCRLEYCLQEYTKLEVLDDYICRKCSLLRTYEKINHQLEEIQDQTKLSNHKKKQVQLLKKKLSMLKSSIEEDVEREFAIPISIERVASLTTTKQTMFARPPDSLTFHISRSTAYARGVSFKNHCQVAYPEYLTLDPYCTTFELSPDATTPISSYRNSQDYRYRLLSVVVHFGSHSFGHYITYRRSPSTLFPKSNSSANLLIQQKAAKIEKDKKERIDEKISKQRNTWYRISDENVQLSSLEDALRSNPFLLMYERIYEDENEQEVQPKASMIELDEDQGRDLKFNNLYHDHHRQKSNSKFIKSDHNESSQSQSFLMKPRARELSWFQIQ